MHLTESDLAALTHGQASAAPREVSTHLAACPDCRGRLETLRAADRDVAELLRGLDHPAPRSSGLGFLDDLQRRRRRIGAIAAGLAVCVAGAAAGLPSSPLHHALLRALSKPEAGRMAPAAVRTPGRPSSKAGVAFIPGRSLDVEFKGSRPGGRLRILIVDGTRMSAIADGDAAFSINQSRLEVNGRGEAIAYTLEIPRAVSEVRVRSGSDTIFQKRGGVITGSYSVDASGAYTFNLGGAPSGQAPRVR